MVLAEGGSLVGAMVRFLLADIELEAASVVRPTT